MHGSWALRRITHGGDGIIGGMSDSHNVPNAADSTASESKRGQLAQAADTITTQLDTINGKVSDMRQHIEDDSDTLVDKIIKLALPAAVSLLVGKLFKLAWDRGLNRHLGGSDRSDDEEQGMLLSVLFTGLSAALTAIASNLSERGSRTLVVHKHRRQRRRSNGSKPARQ